jgi:hypothetical protein
MCTSVQEEPPITMVRNVEVDTRRSLELRESVAHLALEAL